MITLNKACEKAIQHLTNKGYLEGIAGILDIDNIWVFVGSSWLENDVEYGNCPVAINKESGELYDFPISDMDNYAIFEKGKEIAFPEKYKIKGKLKKNEQR